MKKRIGRIVRIMFATMICFSLFCSVLPVNAASTKDNSVIHTGRVQEEYIEATDICSTELLQNQPYYGKIYKSAIYSSEWDKYSSNYYYNLMNSQERNYWERLDAVCANYLLGTENALGSVDNYHTVWVSTGNIDIERAKELAAIFRIYNPQYYFLQPAIWYGTQAGNNLCAIGIYNDFAEGTVRQVSTNTFKSQIDIWETQIATEISDAEKVKKIHDIICLKVDYNNTFIQDGDEERWKSQSAYSVMCSDTTVCAGYSMAFSLLCNGSGIDCISVTSSDHQWNKVRISDSWYNVDCTWDDGTGTTIYYSNFEKNDAYMNTQASHTPEILWNNYLPQCSLDSGASGIQAGRLPTITDRVDGPILRVKNINGMYYADFTAPNGSYVYYTINGGTPSVASSKSNRYAASFLVSASDTIKALTVKDTYLDSQVQNFSVANYIGQIATEYSITYNLNGGFANGLKTKYTSSDETFVLPSPIRTGYEFLGWTGSNGSTPQKSVTISKGSSGNRSYTANWRFVNTTGISYHTHIQDYGWESAWKTNGQMSGTSGQSKRLEAIEVELVNQSVSGAVQYRTHIQDYGWESAWKTDGQMSGTSGQSKRLEAIQIQLTGELSKCYDVYYRVHAQNFGWLDWAKNGQMAGTAGYGYRLEGIEIRLVQKRGAAPGYTASPFRQEYIQYQTHVQDYGWQEHRADGAISGTSGESKRLEGICISLKNQSYGGGVQYRTHIQDIGWESTWRENGQMSGTSGQSKRLEAIQIQLTGDMANYYDIYYQVHAQNYGWLGWAKNGNPAGTAGHSYRLEAIRIIISPKGTAAPGSTASAFIQ